VDFSETERYKLTGLAMGSNVDAGTGPMPGGRSSPRSRFSITAPMSRSPWNGFDQKSVWLSS
jgi:hypothetical protein